MPNQLLNTFLDKILKLEQLLLLRVSDIANSSDDINRAKTGKEVKDFVRNFLVQYRQTGKSITELISAFDAALFSAGFFTCTPPTENQLSAYQLYDSARTNKKISLFIQALKIGPNSPKYKDLYGKRPESERRPEFLQFLKIGLGSWLKGLKPSLLRETNQDKISEALDKVIALFNVSNQTLEEDIKTFLSVMIENNILNSEITQDDIKVCISAHYSRYSYEKIQEGLEDNNEKIKPFIEALQLLERADALSQSKSPKAIAFEKQFISFLHSIDSTNAIGESYFADLKGFKKDKFSIKNYTKTDILLSGWMLMGAINVLHIVMGGLSLISPPIMIANILLSIALLVWPLKRDDDYCKTNQLSDHFISLLLSSLLILCNPVCIFYFFPVMLVECVIMTAVVFKKEIPVKEAKKNIATNIESFTRYLDGIEVAQPKAIVNQEVNPGQDQANNYQDVLIQRQPLSEPLLGQ
jgi:hypothetical protein